jgi:hypothetical protein
MISIVCVCNNRNIFNNYLIDGLKKQSMDYELIIIEDSKTDFKSAAQALNYGGKKAEGDYIIFAHQDVNLDSIDWLKQMELMVHGLPKLGIAGIAGKSESSSEVITNVKHGDSPHFAGNVQIDEPVEVQTLDECLLIIPKKVFEKLEFDEVTCDGWHLYGVDYCLSIKEMDMAVYVLPLPIHHKSSGDPFAKEYYQTLGKIFKKHGRSYNVIHTTVSDWNTKYPVSIEKRRFWLTNKIYSGFKNRIIRILKK